MLKKGAAGVAELRGYAAKAFDSSRGRPVLGSEGRAQASEPRSALHRGVAQRGA
ncbi:MAG: hypothetical protein JWQ55_5228 [Rhodopila sp.]|jgi:hypothetical protein|nr:hypothetical protein [Rhodopila sp.]